MNLVTQESDVIVGRNQCKEVRVRNLRLYWKHATMFDCVYSEKTRNSSTETETKKLSIHQNAYLKVKDIFLARKSIYLHVHCRQCGFLGIRFPTDYFILFYCVFVMRKVLSDSVNKMFVSFII